MIATLLLCSALFAADPAPAQVSVKVLVGTSDKSQTADSDPWINKAVAEAGSPVAAISTDWIKLTGDETRIYTSKDGGVIVHGKVSERNGKYEVEISGCDGFPLEQSITLKPGERSVVKLTDYPAPTNVFIVLTTKDEDRKIGVDKKLPFKAAVGRTDTSIRFQTEGDATVFDITSTSGIDKATIKRESDEWPKTILVRLHLGGLESFKAGGKGFEIEWSVASTADHEATVTLKSGLRVAAVKKDSPFYSEVRIVGSEKKIPLKDGYFEISLPAKLFEGNPQEITLEWIDFYRR